MKNNYYGCRCLKFIVPLCSMKEDKVDVEMGIFCYKLEASFSSPPFLFLFRYNHKTHHRFDPAVMGLSSDLILLVTCAMIYCV